MMEDPKLFARFLTLAMRVLNRDHSLSDVVLPRFLKLMVDILATANGRGATQLIEMGALRELSRLLVDEGGNVGRGSSQITVVKAVQLALLALTAKRWPMDPGSHTVQGGGGGAGAGLATAALQHRSVTSDVDTDVVAATTTTIPEEMISEPASLLQGGTPPVGTATNASSPAAGSKASQTRTLAAAEEGVYIQADDTAGAVPRSVGSERTRGGGGSVAVLGGASMQQASPDLSLCDTADPYADEGGAGRTNVKHAAQLELRLTKEAKEAGGNKSGPLNRSFRRRHPAKATPVLFSPEIQQTSSASNISVVSNHLTPAATPKMAVNKRKQTPTIVSGPSPSVHKRPRLTVHTLSNVQLDALDQDCLKHAQPARKARRNTASTKGKTSARSSSANPMQQASKFGALPLRVLPRSPRSAARDTSSRRKRNKYVRSFCM